MRDKPFTRTCIICGRLFRTYSLRKVKRCDRTDCRKTVYKRYHENDGLSDKQYYEIMHRINIMSEEQKSALYDEVRTQLMREL